MQKISFSKVLCVFKLTMNLFLFIIFFFCFCLFLKRLIQINKIISDYLIFKLLDNTHTILLNNIITSKQFCRCPMSRKKFANVTFLIVHGNLTTQIIVYFKLSNFN